MLKHLYWKWCCVSASLCVLTACQMARLAPAELTTVVGNGDDYAAVRGNDEITASRSEDGLTLVCAIREGNCYTQQPVRNGAPCECASSDGVRTGRGVNAPVGAFINLSSVVQIYFVTDRDRLPTGGVIQTFGTLRSDSFSYGSVQVSIPATHQTGFIEAPSSIVRIRFLEDPLKHVLLLKSTILTKENFLQQLQAQVGKSEKKEAFLFVHGFNTTFEQAALRTAQISFDLGFRGAPIFYSWPSKGSPTPLGYMADSQTIGWAKGNLRKFLEEFLLKTNADHVYLIAHSMGTQVLTETVTALLNTKPELRSKVKEIILAAPDIDASTFRRDIAPAMVRFGSPVTVYASSKDVALQLSHLASNYPRAGDAGSGLVLIDGIETIDASNVSLGFLGHSVFAESRDVLSDWRYIIEKGLRARDRSGLMQVSMPQPYWTFKK